MPLANSNDHGEILDGTALRRRLESELPQSKKTINFISAYITQSGIEWLCKNIPKNIKGQIVCRLIPSDILSGATQLSALRTALDNGLAVSCLHSLHAKIFSIDDLIIYAGSANLTSNGLKIYGQGNLEATVQIQASKTNLDFIRNIVQSATALDEDALKKMQACIDLKESEVFFDRWPEGVLDEQEGIWVRDFFWSQPGSTQNSNETIHDLEIMGIDNFNMEFKLLKRQIEKVRCIRWLLRVLKDEENNELYFGSLTQALHDDLKDDPTPYRKDVKSLLQNMLLYCDIYMKDKIEISRPNYSQRIKLISKS